MSLFDKDFDLDVTLEAAKEAEDVEAKEAEDVKAEEIAEGEEDQEEVEKEAEEAAEFDLNCDSFMECQGSPAIMDAEEELHFISTEAMAMNIAFDRVDTACTEAYVMEADAAVKGNIMTRFKNSVKRYWERFKAFLVKLKNLVIRTAQRVMAFIKSFISKVVAKLAMKWNNGNDLKNKEIGEDVEITVREYVKEDIKKLLGEVVKYTSQVETKLLNLADAGKAEDKSELGNIAILEKEELLKVIVGNSKTMNVSDFGKVNSVIADVKKVDSVVNGVVAKFRDGILKDIKKVEAKANAKGMKDLDTADMTVRMAAINKAVSLYNRRLAVSTSIMTLWVGARVKALNAYGSAKEVEKESYLLDDFFNMI